MICSDELLAFVDDYNQTPLHIAISTGNYKAVCLLCERCNDDLIEIRNGNNENVLELAGQKAILEIFLVVYERFGDFEVYDILKRNFNGMLDLVLHEFFDAIHLKDFVTVCKMLDVHPRLKYQLDHKGWNALHEAAANGLNDMVQLLLEYNKDYNEYLPYRQTKTRDCKNALHLAVERCQVGCVKVLIEGCRNRIFYMKDINDITVDDLIHSLQKEDPKCEIAELITSRQAELGDAKVYFDPDAIKKYSKWICHSQFAENFTNLSLILKKYPYFVEYHIGGHSAFTLLQVASFVGGPRGLQCILDTCVERDYEFIREEQTFQGRTALFYATMYNKPGHVEVLLNGCRSQLLDYRDELNNKASYYAKGEVKHLISEKRKHL
eukprot:TRINITY_DN60210_c0_g2_i3.p1 TRINITY_DN60210_c0_g2~~TRINITY_DN60210_c0_g2_i3.p1  ORF type:complete len:380 (-),score=61.50 TRINITY_DN60210_c0_g2_i3:110-1249(-)